MTAGSAAIQAYRMRKFAKGLCLEGGCWAKSANGVVHCDKHRRLMNKRVANYRKAIKESR